jgi:hypothetical protein
VGVIALITSCGDEYRRERLDPPRSWVASECLGLRSVIRVRRPRRGMSLGAALTNSAQMLVGRRRGRHPGFEQCKGRDDQGESLGEASVDSGVVSGEWAASVARFQTRARVYGRGRGRVRGRGRGVTRR